MGANFRIAIAKHARAIGFAGPKRLGTLADVPTIIEGGFPGFDSSNFKGLMAPAGTPRPIIDKLHAEIKRIAALPDIKERLVTLGAEPSGMTPEQFGQWVKTEIPAMAKIVKDEKITVE
jgi:tripartite-type tricarboxylate transporter receptor subunit TctC